MRQEKDIFEKFQTLYWKCLGERKKKYLCRNHWNCVYNKRHKVKDSGSLGFCHNEKVTQKAKSFIFICNNEEIAEKCEFYCCGHTEELVIKEFDEILREPSRVGQEYPKLAMLIWVLQKNGKVESEAGFVKRLLKFFHKS